MPKFVRYRIENQPEIITSDRGDTCSFCLLYELIYFLLGLMLMKITHIENISSVLQAQSNKYYLVCPDNSSGYYKGNRHTQLN